MENDITYIGTEDNTSTNNNPETNSVQKAEKFKTNTYNKEVSQFIAKTKNNKKYIKIVIIIIVIILVVVFKPITFLKNKLNEKREYYAQLNEANSNFYHIDSLSYSFGVDYYKNCKKTMMIPADGFITCQYDLSHKGIDIACDVYQDNVFAAANGYVYSTGYNEKYGNEITIEHEINGIKIYTYYANLSNILVTPGQYVYQNQVIGNEGGSPVRKSNVADFEGHHVHFEVRKSPKKGTGLNPNIFIVY